MPSCDCIVGVRECFFTAFSTNMSSLVSKANTMDLPVQNTGLTLRFVVAGAYEKTVHAIRCTFFYRNVHGNKGFVALQQVAADVRDG